MESASGKMLPMSIRDDIHLSPDGTHHPLCTVKLSSEGWCVVYGDDMCSSKLQVSAMCACRQFVKYVCILRELSKGIENR